VESSRGRKPTLVGFLARMNDALIGVIDVVTVQILAQVVGELVVGHVLLATGSVNDASDLLGWEVSGKRKSREGCGVDRVGWSDIRMKLSPDRS
jgi:hypothetical protein